MPRRDLLLPVLFGAGGSIEMAVQAYRPLVVSIGTYWLACGALCLRRKIPLVTPLLVAVTFALAAALGFDVSQPAAWILLPALASFAAGRHVPRALVAIGFGAVVIALAVLYLTLATLTSFSPDVLFGLVFTIGPWALGVALREALDRNSELAIEAERARVENAVAAERAAADERKRIARELHDVLAHSLSVMVVQASLAEDLIVRDPSGATAALREVEQMGRNALAETGRLLQLIRDESDELGLRPQVAVADLPGLTQHYARAGLDVRLELDANVEDLPMGVGLSVYRIVQEALTNALKHAPGSSVDVRVAQIDGELAIDIRNGPCAHRPAASESGGHGLTGMRERVSLFGGTLQATPTAEGGFSLVVSLPTPWETA